MVTFTKQYKIEKQILPFYHFYYVNNPSVLRSGLFSLERTIKVQNLLPSSAPFGRALSAENAHMESTQILPSDKDQPFLFFFDFRFEQTNFVH